MANFQDLSAKLDNLTNVIANERQEFINVIAAKDATIADLQNQIANLSTGISATDADQIASRIDSAAGEVGTIVP